MQGVGKKKSSDYDFLQTVFEWIFYNLPARADNTYTRNIFDFYKTHGSLTTKQLQALLKTIDYINIKPPFSTATIEAIIKKKAIKTKKIPPPPPTPLYNEDIESKEKVHRILAIAPAHKAALLYKQKLQLNQPLTSAERDSINKFLQLLEAKRKSA